jgi:acyl-CoA synthetase (NDP forming)/GNAT superfamily N-acetyltransferase
MTLISPPSAGDNVGGVRDEGLDALTVDGSIVRIRPARPKDAAALAALHERASELSLYRRFFSTGKTAIAAEVTRITRPDDGRHVTLVAEESGDILGVASYELLTDQTRAEFAIFVDDAAHSRGIGTLLLEHLAVHARRQGVTDLFGEVLPKNSPMLRVAADLGRPVRMDWDLGLVEVHLATADDGGDALDIRELTSARRSLEPLLAPTTVAVIGAGRSAGDIGHEVLKSIIDGGFTGRLFAINPHADHIAGIDCYPRISALPHHVDLVVVAVPAPQVSDVLREAGASGVRAAVVLSSGFGEDGPEGRARQAEIVRIARSTGMRLVGPNCLGILNNDPDSKLVAMFAAGAPAGGLALASQSGAVGISILEHATRTGIGVASFVSLGNKADVSGNDLLSYWYDDRAAKVLALYLESLGNPRRFARVARAVARRKPVLAVKSGRTIAGSRAGASHTAAAAAPDATIDALFAQAGVIRCDGLGDLIDTARLLVDQPLPRGRRIAIIGNAGGINVLCADAADASGLEVTELPADVVDAVRRAAPNAAATTNPIDLGAAASAESISTTIRAAASAVDAVVVAFGATLASDVPAIIDGISKAAGDVDKPVAIVLLGITDPPVMLGDRRAPVYTLPEDAITALGRAVRYARWRATPTGTRSQLADVDRRRARSIVDMAVRQDGWQDTATVSDLLNCYGIEVTRTFAASTESAALARAAEVGYPVVLKSGNPNLVHKSDVGGVRLNLADDGAVSAAYRAVVEATGDPRVVVQKHCPAGVELVAGVAHDPLFGSVVMCGLGGVQTDLFQDRALRLLPVTDRDAAEMWRGLRGAPLLTGYRGSAPADTAAVELLLERLGRIAEEIPEVAELDLNPIIVHASGIDVVDVKMRLQAVADEPDASLRSLREPR